MNQASKALYAGVTGLLAILGIAQCFYPKGGFAELERRFDAVSGWGAYDIVALMTIALGGIAILLGQVVLVVGITTRNQCALRHQHPGTPRNSDHP